MDQHRDESRTAGTHRSRSILAGFLLLLLAAFSFLAGVALFLRIGLDDRLVARLIVSQVERSSQTKATIASAHLSWLSAFEARLSLRGVEIGDRDGTGMLLRIPRVTLDIRPFMALVGSVHVDLARLTEPLIILPPAGLHRTESAGPAPYRRVLPFLLWPVIERLEIDEGSVRVRNFDSGKAAEQVLLSSLDAVATHLSPAHVDHFSVRGSSRDKDGKGSLHVSGSIFSTPYYGESWKGDVAASVERFPLAGLAVAASWFGTEVPLSGGVLNCRTHVTGDEKKFKLKGEMSLSRATLAPGRFFARTVSLDQARVRFSAERRGGLLRIDMPEVALPGMMLSAEAVLKDLPSPAPALEVSVRGADFHLEKFSPLLPMKLFAAEDQRRLLEAGLTGHLVITGARWTGTVSDVVEGRGRNGMLSLDAFLDGVSGFIPGPGLPVKDATGRLRLGADEVIFNGISLTMGSSPIVLNGWISDLRTSPRSDLFVSVNAQGQDLLPLLENKAMADYMSPWLGWIAEPQGGISVTLDVKGSLKRPSMKGKIVLDNFQCRLGQFPLICKGIHGSLRFRSSEVIFSDLKGVLGESPTEVRGTVSADKTDVTGEVKLTFSDLKKLVSLPGSCDVSGRIPLSLEVKNQGSALGFSVKTDLKDNAVRWGTVVRKAPGVPLGAEVYGLRDSESISIEEAYLILDQTRLSTKAKVDAEGRIMVVVNLPPKGIPTNILIPVVEPGWELQPGGRLEGDAVVRWDTNRQKELSLDANLILSHTSLMLGFRKRVEGLTGSIRCRGKSISALVDRAKIGESELSGNISITDFSKPKTDWSIQFSFLDTTDFTAPAGTVPKSTWGDWIRSNPVVVFLARSTGSGSLKVTKGKTALRAFSDFQAHFEDNNGLIKAPQWQVSFADGVIRGDALFDIRPNTTRPLTLDFQADRLRMERVLLADPERVRVDGDVIAEGHLEWKTNSRIETGGIYKIGHIEARVQEGVIHRFEVLSKIFSLINLGSLLRGRFPDIVTEGLPFQRLTWSMDVFDDKWKVKDLKLLADAARIDAAGMYFSGQERIDFKVDVSPLVGLDALMSGLDSIMSGLFGNPITKDGKTLTTRFRVRGLPSAPDIRLEPFENFRTDKN